MSEKHIYCPECETNVAPVREVNRRTFIRVVSERAAVLAGVTGMLGSGRLLAGDPAKPESKPAEDMIKELFSTLTADQKKSIVMPYDHADEKTKILTRHGMYNAPIGNKLIGDVYTKPQQELCQRILRSICSGEEGWRQISRDGTWDNSQSFEKCGATIFGDPSTNKYSWVFTGHHMTIRCDGNSEEKTAFGGPIYYGHSPNGYSERNIFNYQTKSVVSVYESLNEKQRKQAELSGSPGEQAASVKLRGANEAKPGIAYTDLAKDQQEHVAKVMRTILSPYRKEDADEVMDLIKATGGMEKIHLAFYKDEKMNDAERWHFWRLEGPGFVWNYRVLPHVHTFVNISAKM